MLHSDRADDLDPSEPGITPDALQLPGAALRAMLQSILDGRPLPPGQRGALVCEVLRLRRLAREVTRRPTPAARAD